MYIIYVNIKLPYLIIVCHTQNIIGTQSAQEVYCHPRYVHVVIIQFSCMHVDATLHDNCGNWYRSTATHSDWFLATGVAGTHATNHHALQHCWGSQSPLSAVLAHFRLSKLRAFPYTAREGAKAGWLHLANIQNYGMWLSSYHILTFAIGHKIL